MGLEDFSKAIKGKEHDEGIELRKEDILKARAERIQEELTKDMTVMKCIDSAKQMADAASDADERAKYITIVKKYLDKCSSDDRNFVSSCYCYKTCRTVDLNFRRLLYVIMNKTTFLPPTLYLDHRRQK